MLKVLYLPIGEQSGTCDAWLNVGVQLKTFDFFGMFQHNNDYVGIREKFLDVVKEFQPDLIHMQMQLMDIIDAATVQQARLLKPGVYITNWTGDIRTEANKNFLSLGKAVDLSLISSSGQLDLYIKNGLPNVKYWQIGYDPKNCYPKNYKECRWDVAFLANNYGNTFPDGHLRLEAAHKCFNAFKDKFGLFGSAYPPPLPATAIDPSQANEVYNNSICALSISNFNNVQHYFSDRLLYCLASGRPTIAWHFPGCESYFIEGSEIFYARNTDDIVKIVNFCKNNPETANQIGLNGYKRAFKEHTFTSRIIELLKITNLIEKL
jgi:spore maturation protein CgeB